MKRTKPLCVFLAAVLVLSLCSCSTGSGDTGSSSSSGGSGSGSGGGSGSGSGGGNQSGGLPTGNFKQTGYRKIGTQTIGTTTYDVVTFGNWPQSLKTDSVTVDSTATNVNGIVCYKGDDDEWYMKFSDVNTHEEKYYKLEPIKWRVLSTNYDHDGNPSTTGKKLLLAEKILQGLPYLTYDNDRTINNVTVSPNNYEYSEIRAWLNGLKYYQKASVDGNTILEDGLFNKGFLQYAFTAEEQAEIVATNVDNSESSTNPDSNATLWNSGENQYASATTTSDKIFLLSEQEVTKTEYGFAAYDAEGTDSSRIRKVTDFADASGVNMVSSGDYAGNGIWRLRSPFFASKKHVRSVDIDGSANNISPVDDDGVGVVPALCLE